MRWAVCPRVWRWVRSRRQFHLAASNRLVLWGAALAASAETDRLRTLSDKGEGPAFCDIIRAILCHTILKACRLQASMSTLTWNQAD
jgi:hypothetical protein